MDKQEIDIEIPENRITVTFPEYDYDSLAERVKYDKLAEHLDTSDMVIEGVDPDEIARNLWYHNEGKIREHIINDILFRLDVDDLAERILNKLEARSKANANAQQQAKDLGLKKEV